MTINIYVCVSIQLRAYYVCRYPDNMLKETRESIGERKGPKLPSRNELPAAFDSTVCVKGGATYWKKMRIDESFASPSPCFKKRTIKGGSEKGEKVKGESQKKKRIQRIQADPSRSIGYRRHPHVRHVSR